jgi:hypothetical protein
LDWLEDSDHKKSGFWNSYREVELFIHYLKDEDLSLKKWKSPLYCFFPARASFIYHKLGQRFNLVKQDFKRCKPLSIYLQDTPAESLSYLYIGPYVSNPASVMGHGLLLFKKERKSYVLNTIVDYAAAVPKDDGAFSYALNGIFGGYRGRFATAPLFTKLKSYLKLENRNLWDFELNLTAEEVYFAALYIFELRNKHIFDYYFFDHNCGYLLMSVIDVLRPELNLVDSLNFIVLPNRIPSLLEKNGLIRHQKYRPSYQEKLIASFNSLNKDELRRFNDFLTKQKIPDIKPADKNLSQVMMRYLDYVGTKKGGKLGAKEQQAMDSVALQMIDRKMIFSEKQREAPLSKSDLASVNPLNAHDLFYVNTGVGIEDRGEKRFYTDVILRPFTHDITESDAGYVQYSEIHFMKTTLRLREGDKLRLQRLQLATFSQIPPNIPFENLYSFRSALEIAPRLFSSCLNCYGLNIDLSYGPVWDLLDRRITLYTQMRLLSGYGTFQERDDERSLYYGLGPRLGVIWNTYKYSKLHSYVSFLWNHAKQRNFIQLINQAEFYLGRSHRLTMGFEFQEVVEDKIEQLEGKLSYQYYF